MWTIRWTSTAIQSVNEVSDFVETIWGSKIANHFLDLVDEKMSKEENMQKELLSMHQYKAQLRI